MQRDKQRDNLPASLGPRIDFARRAEENARAAFIKAALAKDSDQRHVDRLRLEWVAAGEALDRLLVALVRATPDGEDAAALLDEAQD